MDKKLLEILACPNCKGKLVYEENTKELVCRFDKIAFPIRNNVPIMLIDEARRLVEKED